MTPRDLLSRYLSRHRTRKYGGIDVRAMLADCHGGRWVPDAPIGDMPLAPAWSLVRLVTYHGN